MYKQTHTCNHKCVIYSCIPFARDRRENVLALGSAILRAIYENDKSMPNIFLDSIDAHPCESQLYSIFTFVSLNDTEYLYSTFMKIYIVHSIKWDWKFNDKTDFLVQRFDRRWNWIVNLIDHFNFHTAYRVFKLNRTLYKLCLKSDRWNCFLKLVLFFIYCIFYLKKEHVTIYLYFHR